MLSQTRPTDVPRSTAANAYELLDDVIAAIEAEHLRLYMPTWALDDEQIDAIANSWSDAYDTRAIPACHTMACVGGWAVILHDGKERAFGPRIFQRAMDLLAPEQFNAFHNQTSESLDMRDDLENNVFCKYPTARRGAPEYVQFVVENIRTFQARWENQLRARVL